MDKGIQRIVLAELRGDGLGLRRFAASGEHKSSKDGRKSNENQGFGSALNIRHSQPQGNAGWMNITPLAKADFHVLGNFNIDVMRNHSFAIEYESLSDKRIQHHRGMGRWSDANTV